MMVEQHERAVNQAIRALNARDWQAYGRGLAESLVTHAPGLREPAKGRDARVEWVKGFLGAFPDGSVKLQQSFGQGDWVCAQASFSGSHTGPLPAPDGHIVPPTNKRVQFSFCIILKFEDGEVTELHEYFDQLEILTQLGLME